MSQLSQPAAPRPATTGATQLAAERVADTVRERITEGDLRSGEALRESGLAVGLQVSRNSVREGFRLLAREGLVVHEQHRGVRVRSLTPDDVTDIYRVRRTVELLGLPRVRPEALATHTAHARAAVAAGDVRAVSTADLRFHQEIVAAVGSPRFDAMFVAVLAELRLAFAAVPDPAAFHAPYADRNEAIVALLTEGRVEDACAELSDYLVAAEAQILAVLPRRS